MDRPNSEYRIAIWLPVALSSIVVLMLGAMYLRFSRDVYVTVVNHGPEILHAVTIEVTGHEQTLGEMMPEQSMHWKMRPSGKSHTEIKYTDGQDQRVVLDAGGYLMGNERGDIVVEIRDGKLEAVRHDVHMSLY
jgi:hypothetical protein